MNKKQRAVWVICFLVVVLLFFSVNTWLGLAVDSAILFALAVILHRRFKTQKTQQKDLTIPQNISFSKKALLLTKHNLKDIIIALVLAFIAATAIEVFNTWMVNHRIQNDAKAVATIIAYDKDSNPFSQGSGFFISSDGRLLTNYHVVAGSDYSSIVAKLPNGAFYKIKNVVRLDTRDDIAILQFDAKDVPTVSLGDSDSLSSGDEVVAIGSPLGFENSVSQGIISNPKRDLEGQYFIQFTAPISSGNSGGGLFNKNGEVVGMTSRAISIPSDLQKDVNSQNVNFAIPSNEIKQINNGQQQTLDDANPEYYYSLGNLADNKNNTDEAIADYQKAISIDATFAEAYVGLGGDCYIKGQYDQELSSYQKAYSLDSKNVNTIWLLASAYEDKGQYDQAISSYEKALQIKPDDKDSIYSLGILYLVKGQRGKLSILIPKLSKLDSGLGKELKILSAM